MFRIKLRNPFKKKAPKNKRRVRKIDIGLPTNFQHTSHLGSTEVTAKLDTLECAMKDKGGYTPGVSAYPTQPVMSTRPIIHERRAEE